MKKILITLIISIFSINIVYANETKKVTLKKCVDGDTAIFIIDNEEIRVRFLAIDTPESVHPTKEVEAYGKNASEYTCNKLTNAKKITLEFDTGSTKTDKYGRTLAWVYVDGSMLQKELIEIGYAKVKYIYGKYKYIDELLKNEKRQLKNNNPEKAPFTISILTTLISLTFLLASKVENQVDMYYLDFYRYTGIVLIGISLLIPVFNKDVNFLEQKRINCTFYCFNHKFNNSILLTSPYN